MANEHPFFSRVVLGLLISVASSCAGAEALRSAADVHLIGRAEHSPGAWRVTWPGVGWRTAFFGSRVGVETQDASGYGDLSNTVDCTDDEVESRRDASQSYAVLAAHKLRADWQLQVAVVRIGSNDFGSPKPL